jgi:hypothetical protein
MRPTEGILALLLVQRCIEAEDVLHLAVQSDTGVVIHRYLYVLGIAFLRQLFGRSARRCLWDSCCGEVREVAG